MSRAILLVLGGVLLGCGGRGEPTLGAPVPARPPADAGPLVASAPDAAPPADAVQPISEVHARGVLARRFRAAGFRIREDVVVAGVTLDGCDPGRRVGYEYVAVEERGLDLTESARAALAEEPGWRVLIVEASDLPTVAARAEAFLAELPPEPASRSASDR